VIIKRITTAILTLIMYVLIPEVGRFLAGFVTFDITNDMVETLTPVAVVMLLAGTYCMSFGVYMIRKVNPNA